jgi:thiol-disulfide isomerase/thioredoxin
MKRPVVLGMILAAGLMTTPAALAQAGAAAPAAAAKPAVLVMGDVAPPIAVETFVKGAPVKEFEKGKAYVVEFWATWCGPCRKAFPHLSSLQKKYKEQGLTVIGVNVWEEGDPADYTPATLEMVKKFVDEQGEKMGYTVAYDGAAGKMNAAYMQAAGQEGIPASFIVNHEGRVAWIGNPHDPQFDTVLDGVVKKTYTIDTAAASRAREDAAKRGEAQAIMGELREKARSGDTDGALAAADKLIALGGMYAEQGASWKFNMLLVEKSDTAAAVAFGRKVYDAVAKNSPMLLNQMAWTIVDPQGTVKDKDLDFAMTCAVRAVEITKEQDGAILDTLARVYFVKGHVAKAIEVQRKAVKIATPEYKAELEKSLAEFEAAAKK